MRKHAFRWVAVSGGFDPLHIGHVRMFKAARKLGDNLVVSRTIEIPLTENLGR
ncbi:MAG: adenylyltransferase/cytidyltransferase family protein [Patescibacteria group bacterium]